jgi:hypothetical protein
VSDSWPASYSGFGMSHLQAVGDGEHLGVWRTEVGGVAALGLGRVDDPVAPDLPHQLLQKGTVPLSPHHIGRQDGPWGHTAQDKIKREVRRSRGAVRRSRHCLCLYLPNAFSTALPHFSYCGLSLMCRPRGPTGMALRHTGANDRTKQSDSVPRPACATD